MSYNAIITKLENVRKHSNADKLNIANCLGYQVIVGLDSKNNDLVILFPDDGQLSEEYCKANDLIGYTDENGVKQGGYFDNRRRVRAQIFRKEKSEAYVASLNSLDFTGVDISTLTIGMKFNEINGFPICNKYITKATKSSIKDKKKDSKKVNELLKRLFPEHKDTEQFRFALDFELYGLATITSKVHGTSARTCYINVPEQNYKWYHKLLRIHPKVKYSWKYLHGTRRVIKGEIDNDATDYRSLCSLQLKPHIQKGEIWYYEIVGYEETGKPIMNSVETSKLPKELQKQFGKTITYKYGCLPGTWDIYVYRITVQNDDGNIYELPWNQVKERCKNSGIKHVPELCNMIIKNTDDITFLKLYISALMDENIEDPIDPSHVKEGFCIRIDSLDSSKMKIFKEKTFIFKVLEGIIKDNDTLVDQEESQGE